MAFRQVFIEGKRASSEGHSWRDAKTKRGHNAGIEVCRQLHNCRHFIRISRAAVACVRHAVAHGMKRSTSVFIAATTATWEFAG
jgi:hypothetical protein